VDAVFKRLEKGEVDPKEQRVFTFSFPYDRNADLTLPFSDPDDEP
jgi:hypothetical protein